MQITFNKMPGSARVWIFQSNQTLTEQQEDTIKQQVGNFLNAWQAHGQDLVAAFTIKYQRFLVISLNEASYQATGCSIDKLTHLVQALEKELNLEFLNRMQIAYRDNENNISTLPLSTFKSALANGSFSKDTTVFNNLVETKSKLETEWEVPLYQSWHKQWLPVA
jgi:hypothetical protein